MASGGRILWEYMLDGYGIIIVLGTAAGQEGELVVTLSLFALARQGSHRSALTEISKVLAGAVRGVVGIKGGVVSGW